MQAIAIAEIFSFSYIPFGGTDAKAVGPKNLCVEKGQLKRPGPRQLGDRLKVPMRELRWRTFAPLKVCNNLVDRPSLRGVE